MAFVFSAKDPFANSFGEGAPVRSIEFSNDEFRVAAQSRFGVPLACLKPYTNQSLRSNNASATDKVFDAFGNNLKKLVGAEGGGALKKPTTRPRTPSRSGAAGPGSHTGGARAAPQGLAKACSPRTPSRFATATSPRRT